MANYPTPTKSMLPKDVTLTEADLDWYDHLIAKLQLHVELGRPTREFHRLCNDQINLTDLARKFFADLLHFETIKDGVQDHIDKMHSLEIPYVPRREYYYRVLLRMLDLSVDIAVDHMLER